MIRYYLEFERPIEQLELKIEELKRVSDGKDVDTSSEIKALRMIKTDGQLKANVVDKILGDNARALYGLN